MSLKRLVFSSTGILLVLLTVASVVALYYQRQYKNLKIKYEEFKKQREKVVDETTKILTDVKKLVVLPEEIPTIATINDVEKLKNRPFFQDAQNGFKVLIFNNAKKAVLYDPVNKKVVNIAPLTFGKTDVQMEEKQVVKKQGLKFILRNGTPKAGLTNSYEKVLIKKIPEAEIIDREKAAYDDYEETIIVDVKGDKEDKLQKIADSLGIRSSSLPDGEETPDTDFLIIVGKDFLEETE